MLQCVVVYRSVLSIRAEHSGVVEGGGGARCCSALQRVTNCYNYSIWCSSDKGIVDLFDAVAVWGSTHALTHT